MTTKTRRKTQRAPIPLTSMVEIPMLTPQECVEFIDSIEQAETRIDAGDFAGYDPDAFEDRLLRPHRNSAA